MSDAYQDGVWLPILLVVFAFGIGKALIWARILTNENFASVSKWACIIIGVLYAIMFEPVRSFGMLDYPIRIGMGAMVSVVIWVFIVMGIGSSLPIDFKKSETSPEQQEENRKGEAL